MFRTKVEYTTAKGRFSKSLIVKTMPELEGHKKDILSDSHLFATEIGMYSKALPEFERILREAGDNTKLYVPCIYHSLEPRQVMVFEDLVAQNYAVIRNRPVKDNELKMVFSKLAKWHAVSMKVLNEQPDFLKDFKYGVWDMSSFLNDPIVTAGMPNFLNMLDKVPDLTRYKPYFEKIKENYMERMGEMMLEYRTNRQSTGYYILCHGDYHIRNMMFRTNSDSKLSDDVMLLDFQFSNLCPITVDLINSVYMLMEPEQRWDLGEEFINYYFSILVETLKKVGYKGEMPTQSGLWEKIRRHKYYDFFLVITFLPMILGIKTNSLKLSEYFSDPETKRNTYFTDAYLEDVRKILPKFEEMGYFENL